VYLKAVWFRLGQLLGASRDAWEVVALGRPLGFSWRVLPARRWGTFSDWGPELWAGHLEEGSPLGRQSASWESKSAIKPLKITLEISMSAFQKMFEEGVKHALKLLQDPQVREGLKETLAKSAEMVFKAGKVVAKQAAKGRRV